MPELKNTYSKLFDLCQKKADPARALRTESASILNLYAII
jgi:hypothetical protein